MRKNFNSVRIKYENKQIIYLYSFDKTLLKKIHGLIIFSFENNHISLQYHQHNYCIIFTISTVMQ